MGGSVRLSGRRSMRSIAAAGILALTTALAPACASVEVSPPIKSCRDYRVDSGYGRFGIQQAGPGKAIHWGAYPSIQYSGTFYSVTVRANGTKIDGKAQSYAPHGSVPASKAVKYSGKILAISGTVTKGGNVVLEFNMQCRIQ